MQIEKDLTMEYLDRMEQALKIILKELKEFNEKHKESDNK